MRFLKLHQSLPATVSEWSSAEMMASIYRNARDGIGRLAEFFVKKYDPQYRPIVALASFVPEISVAVSKAPSASTPCPFWLTLHFISHVAATNARWWKS